MRMHYGAKHRERFRRRLRWQQMPPGNSRQRRTSVAFGAKRTLMRALGRCGASWRGRAGGYFGSPEARGARPGSSLWHVWMALPKPEWINPHRPITVEIAKLINPHRALVSANINFLA